MNWDLANLAHVDDGLVGKSILKVFLPIFQNDIAPLKRICYKQARHSKTGDLLKLRDAVRVNSTDGEANFGAIARLFSDDNGIRILPRL
ncbi:unnamed protein product [Gongylonema pulchrum]|uniref:Transposase n=1 Tax=Gongylonema pulchrum TaxID=637853 RepID=A0A183DKQ3_9BILA|nr:unnamed protein product [Gongylonema pulchrum]